jgi:DNA-binding XRE family transcriptional regulator
MKTFNELVGENIKCARKQANINQEAFGFLLNLTRSSIINIEAGRCGFSCEYLIRVSQICKCSISDILPIDYKFTYPAISDFKARKLTEKTDHLRAKLAEVERQQTDILALKNINGDLTQSLTEFN